MALETREQKGTITKKQDRERNKKKGKYNSIYFVVAGDA
jgi:hypothetical protein